MSVKIHHGPSDDVIQQVVAALERYKVDHTDARIDMYRQNTYSIRVRIVDPGFASCDRIARHDRVWSYLESLSEETLSDVSMLVLIAPNEMPRSIANIEFEDPVPSRL